MNLQFIRVPRQTVVVVGFSSAHKRCHSGKPVRGGNFSDFLFLQECFGCQEKPLFDIAKLERRESTRLQSAAKLLRSLSRSKDLNREGRPQQQQQGPDRKLSRTHSEGKGARRRRRKDRAAADGGKGKRSHSFHGKADGVRNKDVVHLPRASREDLMDFSGAEVYGSLVLNSSGRPVTNYNNLYRDDPDPYAYYAINDDYAASHASLLNGGGGLEEEETYSGARSILLTEHNLQHLQSQQKQVVVWGGNPQHRRRPDLIRDLPTTR